MTISCSSLSTAAITPYPWERGLGPSEFDAVGGLLNRPLINARRDWTHWQSHGDVFQMLEVLYAAVFVILALNVIVVILAVARALHNHS